MQRCPATHLTRSWKRSFEHTGGKPKFQRRSSKDSFRIQIDPRKYAGSLSVHFDTEGLNGGSCTTDPSEIWVKIPNVGRVRVELHEPIYGKVILVTVRRRPAKRLSKKLLDCPDQEPAFWTGYEIVLTVKDVPVTWDRPKNWAKRVDWERDSLKNQGPGLLGAGLGEQDPAGVIALDMSVRSPPRGIPWVDATRIRTPKIATQNT